MQSLKKFEQAKPFFRIEWEMFCPSKQNSKERK